MEEVSFNYIVSRSFEILRTQGFLEWLRGITRFLRFHPLGDEVIYRAYGKAKKETVKNVLDFRMVLDLQDRGICKDLFFNGVREPESTRILIRELSERKAKNVLDIGANIGYYALIEAKNVTGKVYAIEPDPRNFSLLKRNIELNGYLNTIEPYNMAMGDEEGVVELITGQYRNLSRVRGPTDDNEANIVEVATTTVDSFVKNRGVDFIRFDVEGYEYFIVKGMKDTLKKNDLSLCIEVHPPHIRKYGKDIGDFFGMLSDYEVEYICLCCPPPVRNIILPFKGKLPIERTYEVKKPLPQLLENAKVKEVLYQNFYRIFLRK